MLDLDTRRAILQLKQRGLGVRAIARVLRISRPSVRGVLALGIPEVPAIEREQIGAAHLDTLRGLYADCEGNRVRVWEEARKQGIAISYQALTAFLRRQGVGVKHKRAAGRYHFEPGEEMQHDTSPHDVQVGEAVRRLQFASLVLCYSRLIFARAYPVWNRFHARMFLSEAIEHFGGAAARCIIDNSSVIIAHGTGKHAVAAPEMAALAERFDFHFVAHELGDANRSARVERPFHYIEHNFYPGRRVPRDPIRPERVRRIGPDGFAFVPNRFLRDGFFAALRPAERELYFLLVLAGDRNGLSFYHYDSICSLLQMELETYLQARNALVERDLIAYDGTRFQVLSLPERPGPATTRELHTPEDFAEHDQATIRAMLRRSFAPGRDPSDRTP